jgi:hypothetical protein
MDRTAQDIVRKTQAFALAFLYIYIHPSIILTRVKSAEEDLGVWGLVHESITVSERDKILPFVRLQHEVVSATSARI